MTDMPAARPLDERDAAASGSSPSAGSRSKAREVAHIESSRRVAAARRSRRCSPWRWSRRASRRARTRPTRCRSACGPADEGWDERVIGEADGWTVYDALADPAHGRELLHRMRARLGGDRRRTARCASAGRSRRRRAGRHGRRAAGRRRAVELLDRVRRRADPEGVPARRAGRQPRARAAALPVRARASRTSRRWPAGTSTRAALIDATLGILQEYLAGARDGWELALDELASDPAALLDRLRALGARHRRDAHRARLRRRPTRLRARRAVDGGAVAAHRRRRRADRADLPGPARDDEAVAPIARPRPGRARAAAGALAHRRRRPRDPHPRRLPPRPDHALRPRLGDPRLRGRAGAAAARAPAASARRCATSPGMLRSFSYAAGRRAAAARGSRRRRTGRTRAREAFLEGYYRARRPRPAPAGPGRRPSKLLAVFELEKAVYELRYELNNRPDWVSIPVAGILRLLDSGLITRSG